MGNLLQNIQTGEFGLIEFLVSILFSFVAGIICMFLHRIYFSQTFDRNESLAQSFIIIAPAISAIFWAIQYSLPLSLGLLGALSFVRFRTPIKKAEDIGFILMVIAISLLSSIYRFFAAGILLGGITLLVLVRTFLIDKRLPFLKMGTYLTVFLSTKSQKIEEIDAEVRNILSKEFPKLKSDKVKLNDVVQQEIGYSLRYSISFKPYDDRIISKMTAILNKLKDLKRVEVFYGKIG